MPVLKLSIKALSPLAFSERRPGGQFRASAPYVPGSVLRGALAHQFLNLGGATEDEFENLFIKPDAPIFHNAYPAIKSDFGKEDIASRPLPATAFSCKAESGFKSQGHHGVYDSLIDSLCSEELGVKVPYLPHCNHEDHKGKGERVEAFTGFFIGDRNLSVPSQLITRVAINRRRKVAEEGLLYSPLVIGEAAVDKRQTIFQGSIVVNETNRELVKQQLPKLTHIGSGAARGFGHVAVAVEEASMDDLAGRIDNFNEAIRQRWVLWDKLRGKSPDRTPDNGTFFAVLLLSEAILRADEWTPTVRLVPEMLGAAGDGVTLIRCYATAEYRGGWNTAWGLPKETELVARMGSVYVYHTTRRRDDQSWILTLRKLEEQGIGERRIEGFGQVRVCEEFHQVIQGGASMNIATTLRLHKAIQRQIDGLIRAAAKNVALLKNTGMEENQIRNVVNLAAETVSMEEVTNFIRYQIGRKRGDWEDFGKAVIKDIENGAVNTALQAVMKETPDADRVEARAELTARYLGYLNRCFVYAKKANGWDNLCSGLGESGGAS